MSDQLRELIESVRLRLHADLDAQLGALAERHHQAIAETRRTAEQEAEARWGRQPSERHEADQSVSVAALRLINDARHTLLEGIRAIDDARSLAEALDAIVRAAAREAPRAGLFTGAGPSLHEWWVDGASSLIDWQRAAVSIPLLLDGQQVALLCADSDNNSPPLDGWPDGLTVIASHGASRLACITAMKTAQAMRWLAASGAPTSALPVDDVAAAPAASSDEEEQSARRYARLLVSEIKLYNEAAVRSGREQRDLASRLKVEIDRARQMYEQRIPHGVADREALFHNELVQTLGGGDSSLFSQADGT